MIARNIPATQHVYVRQDCARWVWAIHVPHGCGTTSTQSFDSEWQAAQVGARVAAAKGLPFRWAGLTWDVSDDGFERLHQIDMEVDAAQGEGESYSYGPVWA